MAGTSPDNPDAALQSTGNESESRRGATDSSLSKRALFILNPRAGRGRASKIAAELEAAAADLEWESEFRETREAGEEVELGAQAASEAWPVVVVVGGDGTVHGVANGLLRNGQPQTALGHIPVGTGNDFAKTVGLGKAESPSLNLRRTLLGRKRRLDVGRALGEYFVNSIGVGFTAEAARNLARFKRLGGFAAYIATVYRTFLTFKAPQLSLRTSEYQERGRIFMVEITLGRTTGGGFTVSPDADPFDGLMDVCLVRDVRMLTFLRYVPKVIRGTHVGLPPVEVFQTRHATVESLEEPYFVHLDGEIRSVDQSTISVEISPGLLPVLCAT